MNELVFRLANPDDLPELVRLRDEAARWQVSRGIDQWKPGEMDFTHFQRRMDEGEVWLATFGGRTAGAWELWWDDQDAWGVRPPDAGYVHRLMTDRDTAPPGAGRAMLAEAERRIASAGKIYCRLDCLATNPRLRAYYESAGYTFVGEKSDQVGKPYAVHLLEKKVVLVPP